MYKIFYPFIKGILHKHDAMKTTIRILILLIACTGWVPALGQKAKKLLLVADKYFSSGEYYTAAYLYDQYLNPASSQHANDVKGGFPLNTKRNANIPGRKRTGHTDIYFKQAESYRLANYWQKAAAAYKVCIDKSTAKYPDALYWYAVCQRSLNEYAAAEESLLTYLKEDGLNKQFKKEAEKELLTLQYIQQQFARRDSLLVDARKLNARGSSEKGMFAPVHVTGNLFLLSTTQQDSEAKDSINPYLSRLLYANLNNDSLEEAALLVFSGMNNQGAAGISADGNYLYFTQWKKENGHTVSFIYYTEKQAGNWGAWGAPVLLPLVNLEGYNSKQPFCSSDGKYLFFSSDRPGGSGKFDIWYAPLNKNGITGTPVNIGTAINTSGDEEAPFYHDSSATLVFSSNGWPGMGGFDLFTAKGKGLTWQAPENMGFPVNSSRDDSYFFAASKTSLLDNSLFSSDRGSGCCYETYRIVGIPKNRRVGGILRDCTKNIPVAGAEIILQDALGKRWKSVTDTNGRYVFELMNDTYQDLTLTINSRSHKETRPSFKIKNLDESDLLTDKLTNIDLCVEEKLVIKPQDVVSVYFDFDKSELKPATLSKLDSIYNLLTESPAATIQVSGYTDGVGSQKYNNKLSDKRARACAAYLVKKGINASRITFVSFGACCPVEMEIINGRDNPDGRSRNRRALINIKKE